MQIFVRLMSGRTVGVDVSGAMTVAQLKSIIAAKEPVAASAQKLIYAGNTLQDDKTMADYDIPHEGTIYLIEAKDPKPVPQTAPTTIQVTALISAGKTSLVTVALTDSVATLKQKIAEQAGLSAAEWRLSIMGVIVADESQTVASLKMTDSTAVSLVHALQGGY